MTRLILDQGLPRRAAPHLNAKGYDVVHVGDLGMAAATDDAIIQKALDDERSVVTLDSDFARTVALSGLTQPTVIHLRMQGLNLRLTAALLEDILPQLSDEIAAGSLISVSSRGIRTRRLPIPLPRSGA